MNYLVHSFIECKKNWFKNATFIMMKLMRASTKENLDVKSYKNILVIILLKNGQILLI